MIRSALSLLSALVIGSMLPATASYAGASSDVPLDDGQENETDLDQAIENETLGDADAAPDTTATDDSSDTGSEDDAPLYNEQEEAIVDQETLNRVGEEQGGPDPLPDEQYQ
jgi:hypothetical protein